MSDIYLRPHKLVNGINRHFEWKNDQNGGQEGKQSAHRFFQKVYGLAYADRENEIFEGIINDSNLVVIITNSWDDLCQVCTKKNKECIYEFEDQNELNFMKIMSIPIKTPIQSGYIIQQMDKHFTKFFGHSIYFK